MKRVWPYLGLLLVGWVAAWLSVGLCQGDPTAALHARLTGDLRVTYVVVLYLWLVGATVFYWRRQGPRCWGWGRPQQLATGVAIGLGSICVQRAVLYAGGWWTPPPFPALGALALAAFTSLALAVVEEAVFRGYLLGVVYEDSGRWRALIGVSLFFASVHLFRHGTASFKAAYGLGLFLSALVLARVVERSGSLWPAVGIHASWIVVSVLDPPGRVTPGLLPGLGGDPAAGLVGWILLLGLLLLVPWLVPAPTVETPPDGEPVP